MERRHFLKLAFGLAGAAALAGSAEAAPLPPRPLAKDGPGAGADVHPAVTTGAEVDKIKPEQVRWGHHWHGRGHWHHRHWGWRRRHWGWRRHHRWHRRWHRWHRHRHW